jgi:hypothetical protein
MFKKYIETRDVHGTKNNFLIPVNALIFAKAANECSVSSE